MSQQAEIVMSAIEQSLPPFFSRDVAANHLLGILTKKTLANLDSCGRGDFNRVKIGGKIVYELSSFMNWLREYSQASM